METNQPSEVKLKSTSNRKKGFIALLVLQLLIFVFALLYVNPSSQASVYTNRIENLLISRTSYLFGIDVSHYQGKINWPEVQESRHSINYVFIRATMGRNGRDKQFAYNWKQAQAHNYLRGAYHYYRPNESSTAQFRNYRSVVKLKSGDFVPILDVEKESKYGRDNLRKGVLNWLKLAEAEYGVKPVIYTGLKFYQHVLEGYVDDYPLWIAAYSGKRRVRNVDWTFHQFTDKVRVRGINEPVDGNDFVGKLDDLKAMCLP